MSRDELIKEAYLLGLTEGLQKKAFKSWFNKAVGLLDTAANAAVIWEKLRRAGHATKTHVPGFVESLKNKGVRRILEEDVARYLDELRAALGPSHGAPTIPHTQEPVKKEIPIQHILLGAGLGLGAGAGAMYLLKSRPIQITRNED